MPVGRVWIISGIGLLISGCTLSAGTQLTSYAIQAVQAVTLAVTEKSVMDHGISAIAQQDCVLRRILASEPICKDIDDLDGALAIAAANGDLDATTGVAVVDAAEVSEAANQVTAIQTANGDMDATSGVAVVDAAGVAEAAKQVITIQTSALQDVAAPLPVSLKPKPGEKAGDLYFIIGSFNTDSRAKRFVSQYPSLSPKVVRAQAKGRRVYRVAVGPFARDDADLQRKRLAAAGITSAWAIPYDLAR